MLSMNQPQDQVIAVQQDQTWHEIYGNNGHSTESYGENSESVNFSCNSLKRNLTMIMPTITTGRVSILTHGATIRSNIVVLVAE